jgi:hypothetical protein
MEKLDLPACGPAERRVARSKVEALLLDFLVKRNIKGDNLGNDLYPSAARAKQRMSLYFVDSGFNPDIKFTAGSFMDAWMVFDMVTLDEK